MLDSSGHGQPDGPSGVSEYCPKIMSVLFTVFALFLQLLLGGTFYLSNLVFAIHIHCMAYLVFAVTIPLDGYQQHHQIFIYLQNPFIVCLLAYVVLALKRYYAQSWWWVIVKFSVLLVLYAAVMGISFDYILTLAS